MGKGDESAPIRIGDRYAETAPKRRHIPLPTGLCVSEKSFEKSLPPAELRKGDRKRCGSVCVCECKEKKRRFRELAETDTGAPT
jgi:hypothetical protein